VAVHLLITDKNLVVQGDPLDGWTSLDCTRRFNEPGSGQVSLPARPDIMAQLQPGNRLVVIRDRAVWMAGPLEIPTDYSWSVTEAPGEGRVEVTFADDLATVAGYITWPAPASAWSTQPANTQRQINDVSAETIVRTLVDENCGPGARAERRIPQFVLDPVAGVGTSTSVSTRFEPVLDAARRAALAGGIGFRTRQAGGKIRFGCYAPADRTGIARFSIGLGNLRSIQARHSAPTVTHALVGGTEPDTGTTGRAYLQVADTAAAASWWRVERYLDGGADNDADGALTRAGTEAIASGAASVELATVTVDTPDLKAGRDFSLGDRVTVALPYGVEVADVVRSIHLQATPESGEYVTSVIGSHEATTDPAMVRLVQDLGRRIGRLETR
jgi:hypothetical protein